MALLKHTRSAAKVKMASFEFTITDTMLAVAGAVAAFNTAAPAYDVIPLPVGARVVAGELLVKVISDDSSTATLSVGDSASAARYLAATSIKTVARVALVPTTFVSGGEPIRITLANAGANATVGKVRVNVQYVVEGAADEAIGGSGVST